MGAGGRHWGLLVQKFRVSACAGVDVKSSIQHAPSEDSQEAVVAGGDSKEAWVDYELRKEEGAGSEPGEAETDLLLEAPDKVSCSLLCFESDALIHLNPKLYSTISSYYSGHHGFPSVTTCSIWRANTEIDCGASIECTTQLKFSFQVLVGCRSGSCHSRSISCQTCLNIMNN